MSARDRILGRLRQAQAPFADVEAPSERRRMIPMPEMDEADRVARFIREAELLGSFVYQVDENEAIEQIMDLLAGDRNVLSWADAHMPIAGLSRHARFARRLRSRAQ